MWARIRLSSGWSESLAFEGLQTCESLHKKGSFYTSISIYSSMASRNERINASVSVGLAPFKIVATSAEPTMTPSEW